MCELPGAARDVATLVGPVATRDRQVPRRRDDRNPSAIAGSRVGVTRLGLAARPGRGAHLWPQFGPQLSVAGGLSGCEKLVPSVRLTAKSLQMRLLRRRVSDGTRTRDRLGHKQGVGSGAVARSSALHRHICGLRVHRATRRARVDPGGYGAIPVGFAPNPGAWARPTRTATFSGGVTSRALRLCDCPAPDTPGP